MQLFLAEAYMVPLYTDGETHIANTQSKLNEKLYTILNEDQDYKAIWLFNYINMVIDLD